MKQFTTEIVAFEDDELGVVWGWHVKDEAGDIVDWGSCAATPEEAQALADSFIFAANSPTATRTILGHTLTLPKGHRYVAMRPLVRPGAKPSTTYNVTIYELREDGREGEAVLVLPDLPEAQATAFLAAFNTTGPNSLDGRLW
jgi:hypothetical protein